MMMNRTMGGATEVALHRVDADWGEGASAAYLEEGGGGYSQLGDATWQHRFFDSESWQTPGGDFSATPSSLTIVEGIDVYTWGPTAQMAKDVQEWLDNPLTNFGWIVIGNEVNNRTAKRFSSRENTTQSNRPLLHIKFTAPKE